MKKIALVVNKKALNAEQIDNYLQAFDEENIQYTFFKLEPGELESKIKDCLHQFELLLVGGGDGTIRTAAQVCANQSLALGVLPLGTMNHFAKEAGLPLTIGELITALKNPKFIKIDLAEVNHYVFLNNSSIGFYPKLAKQRDHYAKHYHKWLSYIPSIVKTFSYHESFRISVRAPEFNIELYTSFLMLSNNLYTYTFPASVARENFHHSTLGIYFLKRGKMTVGKIFHHLFRRKNHFEIMKSKGPVEVNIRNREEIHVSLDGDTLMMHTPLVYRSLPNSLTLLTSS
ncbi:diacylglycerol kinase [Legionella jordanis]|uniref:diacylglycerol/lipid kinase family protein n=1 Tax=Legionella jordanis TaxID=456 RepID=UPI000EFE6A61|nr:diacylglycerol kinase family protein [Legionella jordanis]RMX21055.1 diacylglycerol kinase [Legionella jordanis]HAT8713475.1 diacylglycerol kinase [Legionella jordanis]